MQVSVLDVDNKLVVSAGKPFIYIMKSIFHRSKVSKTTFCFMLKTTSLVQVGSSAFVLDIK